MLDRTDYDDDYDYEIQAERDERDEYIENEKLRCAEYERDNEQE